jgi:hypothetical protein
MAASLIIGRAEKSGEDHGSPVIAGSKPERLRRIPPSALQKTYTHHSIRAERDMIPLLSTTSYYNFLSATMITLFVLTLAIIFVYEYEVLRRPKNQS